MAPAYQVHLGICIPEVKQLGACPFRPLCAYRTLEGGSDSWSETTAPYCLAVFFPVCITN